ncbi:MAG: methyltransferase domain-containing protein [Anaerolineae bacterium]|nr:methyltransferase domain-containing protein [Anaerolineae bacterium]
MEPADRAWDEIFQREGRVYLEPAAKVVEFCEAWRESGCSRILDLGCGSGRHTVHLAQQGFQVWGLDSSPTALHLAQAWLDEADAAAELVLADTRQPLPFGDGAFDGLLSTQVIHHARLATVCGTAREISRVVRPGGVALVTVPVEPEPDEEHEEIEPKTFVPLNGPERGLPHHIFTPDELCALFDLFRVVEVSILGGVVISLAAIRV